jgi:hypothetical protein
LTKFAEGYHGQSTLELGIDHSQAAAILASILSTASICAKRRGLSPPYKSLLFEVVVIQAGWEALPLLNVPVIGGSGIGVGGITVLPVGGRLGAFLARPVFRTAHDQTPSERSPMAPSKDPDLAKPFSVTQVSYTETGQRGSQPFLRQRTGVAI